MGKTKISVFKPSARIPFRQQRNPDDEPIFNGTRTEQHRDCAHLIVKSAAAEHSAAFRSRRKTVIYSLLPNCVSCSFL